MCVYTIVIMQIITLVQVVELVKGNCARFYDNNLINEFQVKI